MKLEVDRQGSQVSSLGKKCSEHGPPRMGGKRGGSEKQERAIDRICCREKIIGHLHVTGDKIWLRVPDLIAEKSAVFVRRVILCKPGSDNLDQEEEKEPGIVDPGKGEET